MDALTYAFGFILLAAFHPWFLIPYVLLGIIVFFAGIYGLPNVIRSIGRGILFVCGTALLLYGIYGGSFNPQPTNTCGGRVWKSKDAAPPCISPVTHVELIDPKPISGAAEVK